MISLVIIEGMVVIYFWPVSFFVSAGLLTLVLYFILNLSRYYLLQSLTRRLLIRFTVVSSIAAVLILSTAHWTYS